jgi:hypothetical protein
MPALTPEEVWIEGSFRDALYHLMDLRKPGDAWVWWSRHLDTDHVTYEVFPQGKTFTEALCEFVRVNGFMYELHIEHEGAIPTVRIFRPALKHLAEMFDRAKGTATRLPDSALDLGLKPFPEDEDVPTAVYWLEVGRQAYSAYQALLRRHGLACSFRNRPDASALAGPEIVCEWLQ